MEEESPLFAYCFTFYIILGLFVMMNLVLNVFQDQLVKAIRDDKDTDLSERVRHLFAKETNLITWDMFAAKLGDDAMVAYLNAIDVFPNVDQAKGIFDLLDVEGAGSLDPSDVVGRLLRLRGPGRALDL